MRTIINDYKESKIELLDGVKLYSEQGWVLILPDAEIPAFKIIAESSSEVEAEKITEEYYSIVERIIVNN